MGFFDKLEKFIEKADKFIDENFSEEVVSNKTVYSQDALISKCENDCSILHDALLSRAQAISKETVKLDWEWSTTGNSTIKEVSDGIYLVTVNGSVYGRDKFGNHSDLFNYTKLIYMDKYGYLNTTIGQSSVLLKKRL
jgi:hypothetical protein